jgi:hypothetical protein
MSVPLQALNNATTAPPVIALSIGAITVTAGGHIVLGRGWRFDLQGRPDRPDWQRAYTAEIALAALDALAQVIRDQECEGLAWHQRMPLREMAFEACWAAIDRARPPRSSWWQRLKARVAWKR